MASCKGRGNAICGGSSAAAGGSLLTASSLTSSMVWWIWSRKIRAAARSCVACGGGLVGTKCSTVHSGLRCRSLLKAHCSIQLALNLLWWLAILWIVTRAPLVERANACRTVQRSRSLRLSLHSSGFDKACWSVPTTCALSDHRRAGCPCRSAYQAVCWAEPHGGHSVRISGARPRRLQTHLP